jgi:hypothetical protein
VIDRSFIPPPKPDVRAPNVIPEERARPDATRWLTAAIWTAVASAAICFVLMLTVDRSFGWPAYTSVFTAALFTVIRARRNP